MKCQEYLDTIPADVRVGPNKSQKRAGKVLLLNHWTSTPMAALPFDSVTPSIVRDQLNKWEKEGAEGSTRANRRDALSVVYNYFNGLSGYNPVRDTKNPRPQYTDIRGFDMAFLQKQIDAMEDRGRPEQRKAEGKKIKRSTVSGAKWRLNVMLNTAIPPATLGRLQPSDLNMELREVTLRKRKKGKGAAGRTLPLTDEGFAAFQKFIEYNLFGPFDQNGVNAAFMRRIDKAREEWAEEHKQDHKPFPLPDDFTTYDLRHSFLTDFFRRTQDLAQTGIYAGHAPGSKLTLRYALGGVSAVLRSAVAKMNGSRDLHP
jgi:integrase